MQASGHRCHNGALAQQAEVAEVRHWQESATAATAAAAGGSACAFIRPSPHRLTRLIHAAHIDDHVERLQHLWVAAANDFGGAKLGRLLEQEAAQGLIAVKAARVGADLRHPLALGSNSGHATDGMLPAEQAGDAQRSSHAGLIGEGR